MKTIEIVSHCYAGEFVHYSSALIYQLSSMVLNPPQRCNAEITVCCEPRDGLTRQVLQFFRHTSLMLNELYLPIEQLGRRAIGRNIAARHSTADIVWFTDVDVCFGDSCLDALATWDWPDGVTIAYPPNTWISRDHISGDRALAIVEGQPLKLAELPLLQFVPKRYTSAIGPVQIVQGSFAREHGYLDQHPKWQRPVSNSRFARCSEDPVYRRFCKRHGRSAAVDLPNVYRIRHTEAASSGHTVP